MAGQRDYYVTHQCFLSPNALYLVVWDLRLHQEGVLNLRPWLLNIQSRAPDSPVIIIGTFLDRLDPDVTKREEKIHQMQQLIYSKYGRPGYPKIKGIAEVSCKTMKGIPELKELIYKVAVSMTDIDSSTTKLIGRLVPRSYLELEKLILEEARKRKADGQHPVLLEDEFKKLVQLIPKEVQDIDTSEERNQAARFLHEAGIVLHYSDQHRALNALYFIDPSWLCDMLANVVNVRVVQNGMLKLKSLETCLSVNDEKRFPRDLFYEYLHLLERFDIGLQLHEDRLLIPSKLPESRPAVTHGGSGMTSEHKLYRWYKMQHIPSGFWSRLIVRILVGTRQEKHLFSLRNSTLIMHGESCERGKLTKQWSLKGSKKRFQMMDENLVWWRHGIIVHHKEGHFIIESSGDIFPDPNDHQGILVTVFSKVDDFSAMGFIADQIDALVSEWFPGLEGMNEFGQATISRIIPCPLCLKRQDDPSDYHALLQVRHFSFEDCAVAALENEECMINCQLHEQGVPLKVLVPDLLLSDLPEALALKPDHLKLEETEENRLGQGGYACVYRAMYEGKEVAAKVFHSVKKIISLTKSMDSGVGQGVGDTASTDTASVASSTGISDTRTDVGRSHQLGSLRVSFEDRGLQVITMFRELRSEVALMSKLRHPCIVKLVATSIRPPCFLLELAPMGNLLTVLQNEVKEKASGKDTMALYRRKDSDVTSPLVFSKMLTYKLVLQVACAIRYLHKYNIIYRDLKCQNILVWNLDLNHPVNIKLSDYGISCFNTPQGIMGNEGTPGYQAPEIQTGVAYDEKVDLFSLGMVIYVMMSGHRPFEQYAHPGQVVRAIRNGERPSLQADNIDAKFPCLEKLMVACWDANPDNRPSAESIVDNMTMPKFVCQERVLPQPGHGVISTINCMYASKSESRNRLVWIWSSKNDERVFSVVDIEQGVFRVNKRKCPGPKALCTTRVGNTMWVGNEQNDIEVLGYPSVGLPQTLDVIHLKSTPLALLYEVMKDSYVSSSSCGNLALQRVYVAQKKGLVTVFGCNDAMPKSKLLRSAAIRSIQGAPKPVDITKWQKVKEFHLPDDSDGTTPVTCLEAVDFTEEIWIGCGNSVAIVDSKTLKLSDERISMKTKNYVKQLSSLDKRIWCLQQWSCDIFQFDVETRTLQYVFNCFEGQINNVIADQMFVPEGAVQDSDIRLEGSSTIGASGSEPIGRKEECENEYSDPSVTIRNEAEPAGSQTDGATGTKFPGAIGGQAAGGCATGISNLPEISGPAERNGSHSNPPNKLVENYLKLIGSSYQGGGPDTPGGNISPYVSGEVRSMLQSLTKSWNESDAENSSTGLSTFSRARNPEASSGQGTFKKYLGARGDEVETNKSDDTLKVLTLPSSQCMLPERPRMWSDLPRRGLRKFERKCRKTYSRQSMHYVKSILLLKNQTMWIGLNNGDILVVNSDMFGYNPYGQILSILSAETLDGHKNGQVRHLVAVGREHVLASRLFNKIEDSVPTEDVPTSVRKRQFGEAQDDDAPVDDESCVYQLSVWQAFGAEEFYKVQTIYNQLRTAEFEK